MSGLRLTDLPEDIIYALIHYLSVEDFIAFCSCSKVFYDNQDIRFSASYWSGIAHSTFRLPNFPVVSRDGRVWMALYRRMLHDTKIYGWGNNDKGCLEAELQRQDTQLSGSRGGLQGRLFGIPRPPLRRYLPWPEELTIGQGHIVSDLQCGGWSITALTSRGVLLTNGVIDGNNDYIRDRPTSHTLKYPPGYVSPTDRYDPSTAIKQFSAGRGHILGLADSGRIWSWDDTNRPAVHVKFLTIDLTENGSDTFSTISGQVTKVVAGWNRSSAYVIGKGIVTWQPSNISELQGESDQSSVDGMLVLEPWIVPLTSYRPLGASKTNARTMNGLLEETDKSVGEVCNWCVLHHYVVFSTTTGHVYFSKIPNETETILSSMCLTDHLDFSDSSQSGHQAIDLQGAHLSFAVFQRNGNVLVSNEDYLDNVWTQGFEKAGVDGFLRYHCLQNTGVLKIAFGDHHWHALHSNGTISSYGKEVQSRGSLGLGGEAAGRERGLKKSEDFPGHRSLADECYTTGRKVFFEPEKRLWLDWISSSQSESTENLVAYRHHTLFDGLKDLEASEWFETKLSEWESYPQQETGEGPVFHPSHETDDDGLPSYFALNVAAGGWHSGAIVLVNQAKAAATRTKYVSTKHPIPDKTSEPGDVKWSWEEQDHGFPEFHFKDGSSIDYPFPTNGREIVHTPQWLKDEGWKTVKRLPL